MAIKPTQMMGQWLPDTISEDHDWKGTHTIALVVATSLQNSSGNAVTWNKVTDLSEAVNIATLTVGTVTHYLSFGGLKLSLSRGLTFTAAGTLGTLVFGTTTFLISGSAVGS